MSGSGLEDPGLGARPCTRYRRNRENDVRVLLSMVLDAQVGPTGVAPTLNLTVNNAPVVTAACMLATDKSLVVLPNTAAAEIMSAGYSASRDVQAQITCPANTTLSGGTTLTLSTPQADTDSTLVKNTGTAQGVAIEVLEGTTRVSVSGGTVSQAAFTRVAAPPMRVLRRP